MGISQELVIHFQGEKSPGSFFQLDGLSKIYEICRNGIHHVPFLRDIFFKNVYSQGSKKGQIGIFIMGHQVCLGGPLRVYLPGNPVGIQSEGVMMYGTLGLRVLGCGGR